MEGHRLIHQLMLRNFLSYGREGVTIDLHPLNVLIGPNASGKSNLIEAIGVLRATPRDLVAHFRERGGAGDYIRSGGSFPELATISSVIDYPEFQREFRLHHSIDVFARAHGVGIAKEEIEFGVTLREEFEGKVRSVVYAHRDGKPMINTLVDFGTELSEQLLPVEGLKPDQSILAQRRDPRAFPEVTYLAEQFEQIAIYQDWTLGRRNQARSAQGTDLPSNFLLPDASNLALVLNELMQRSATRDKLLTYLQRFYEAAQFISTKIAAARVQLFIEESGGALIPATRLSDGTLRYLSLLAILCHPSPPPLICIEEPELGLHPDVVPTIAELLKDASERTQLVVTTHSDALVSALSDVPESVIVCESGTDGTRLRRLDPDALAAWLEKYALGDLWRMGEIGGNRW
jgi:predicted ATPase